MSWLSKALGLDRKPKLLAEINKVGGDLLSVATRAAAKSLNELADDRDWDAFLQRMRTELAMIVTAKGIEQRDRMLEDLIKKIEEIR